LLKHISYSAWMLFRRGCQHRFKLDYLEKRRRRDFGVHMDFGTAVHESIELYRARRRNPHATVDAVVFFFRQKLRWLYDEHRSLYSPPSEETFSRRCQERVTDEWGYEEQCFHFGRHRCDHQTALQFFYEAGERILRRLDECDELREAEVVYNEHRLSVPIERDDMEVKFKGFIDMVIKTRDKRGNTILYVCDFKTCSWGWDLDKKQDKELHYQILLYKHFLCKKFDLDPKLVRTAFVLLKKKPRPDKSTGDLQPPVEWLPISAGPVSVQRALDELNSDLTQIRLRSESGEFRKNRDFCVSDFGDVCPYRNTELCPDEKRS
jgi:hypothetical protein